MGILKKRKVDPISDRARALNAEIAALEAQIQKLNHQTARKSGHPRVRSTVMPQGPTAAAPTPPGNGRPEPLFEDIDQNRLKAQPEPGITPAHYNELGVRKYDLIAFIRRIQNHLRGKPVANPRLVNYLAAGSIQGLRPLRYEKRVARNRFIFHTIVFLLVLWGIIAAIVRHH